MDNLFVARIYNNILGSCVMVGTVTDGKNLIREKVKEQFERDLTAEENDVLENDFEFFHSDDDGNVTVFSIASLTSV